MGMLMCLTLCLLLVEFPSALTFSLGDCDQRAFLTGTRPIVECTAIDSDNNIYWSVTVNGHQTRIAECRQCSGNNNCPPCLVSNSFLYTVERFPNKSTLRLLDSVQNLNGATVVCSSFSNNSQARCDLNVVKEFGVGACQQGYIDVEEDRKTTLVCENPDPSLDVTWNLNFVNGERFQIASCLRCGTCPMQCVIKFPRFIAKRTKTNSKLVVVVPRREDGGKMMQCANGNNMIDECKIRVVRKAELQNASVSWHNTWNVTGTVSFNNLYTSDNNTICRWYTTNQGQTKRLSTAPTELSTYLDNDKLFFRGKCDAEIELMTSDGAHLISVEMIPGHGPIFAGTIYTVGPGKLTTLNNTCPAYVAEGSDVRCQCGYLPAQQGSPPAHVSWVHGAMSAVLELDNVERQQHGNVYRCHSVWGAGGEINAYYNYTLQVAYGPTRNDITSAKLSDPDQNATLTCTSDYVFPSANFSWSITCLTETINRQSSACTVIPEVIMHETEVVCVVSNFQLPDLHSTAVFKIGGTHDDKNKDVTVVAVAGGVGCVAFVAVVVVAIVVIVCKCRDKTYEKPRRRRQPSHLYLDLHHGTNTASAPSQQIISGDLNNAALSLDADYLTPVCATVSASDAVPEYINIMGKAPVCEHSATYVNHPPAPASEQDENHYYSHARDDVSTHSESTGQWGGHPDTDTSVYEEVK